MASDANFVAYVCEQAGLGGELTSRKMFGEYALYLDGKVIALVCDNCLYVKPTEEGRGMLTTIAEEPPYPGAKPHLRIGEEVEDGDFLRRLFQVTARALPEPKPRKRKA